MHAIQCPTPAGPAASSARWKPGTTARLRDPRHPPGPSVRTAGGPRGAGSLAAVPHSRPVPGPRTLIACDYTRHWGAVEYCIVADTPEEALEMERVLLETPTGASGPARPRGGIR
ncbi:peptide ligase PGM1-related protein [Streptomyces sp. NPDC051582]|uniref:peptide ligase PGM1-related protein n=1 Tax=Streptomyces sp. NPDC051582 TaxID=3155167 RepID=UPI003418E596